MMMVSLPAIVRASILLGRGEDLASTSIPLAVQAALPQNITELMLGKTLEEFLAALLGL